MIDLTTFSKAIEAVIKPAIEKQMLSSNFLNTMGTISNPYRPIMTSSMGTVYGTVSSAYTAGTLNNMGFVQAAPVKPMEPPKESDVDVLKRLLEAKI